MKIRIKAKASFKVNAPLAHQEAAAKREAANAVAAFIINKNLINVKYSGRTDDDNTSEYDVDLEVFVLSSNKYQAIKDNLLIALRCVNDKRAIQAIRDINKLITG